MATLLKSYINPAKNTWAELLKRPAINPLLLQDQVKTVLEKVKQEGDNALYAYTEQFDGVTLSSLRVSDEEIKEAKQKVSPALQAAIELAASNIQKFHSQQLQEPVYIETMPGVVCWRKSVGIDKVGLYIPGGSAPLFSTVLMLGIPAAIANCQERILCTPPNKEGKIHPAILFAANLVGIKKIYKVGGAQAIAAMAYGTESIEKVYKIFGPGNQYVTCAKSLVSQEATAIDMPAGPSELAVVADKSCVPAFVAADLLSQAEHGADSQVLIFTTNAAILNQIDSELQQQLAALPRQAIAAKALSNSKVFVLENEIDLVEMVNCYAPEHLILATANADELANKITNAGSIFIGNYTPESAGDYASGTNHTLPTNGYAQMYSGVSLDSFVKKITFQKINPTGIQNIGPSIELMAEAEELFAHKNAVSLRLKNL